MGQPNKISKSLVYAWHGLDYVFKSQRNFRIQIIVALLVILAGLYFGLSRQEWIILLFLIALVLILEILNTVLETFIDVLKPKIHHYVQIIKDLMAAAVLLASLVAALIGLIIFLPHLTK